MAGRRYSGFVPALKEVWSRLHIQLRPTSMRNGVVTQRSVERVYYSMLSNEDA